MNTGIDIVSIPGIIPEFYEREACNKANYQFDTTWQDLTSIQKAEVVAHYLLRNQIDNHIQDTQIAESKRKSKKKK
jgi:hypothetical protein